MGHGLSARVEEYLRFLESDRTNRKLRERCERLRKVAIAADRAGNFEDIGDDVYDAIDDLEMGDLEDNLRG
jgi:hypothetical protein